MQWIVVNNLKKHSTRVVEHNNQGNSSSSSKELFTRRSRPTKSH